MFSADEKNDFQSLVESLRFRALFSGAGGLIGGHLVVVQKLLMDFVNNDTLMSNRDRELFFQLSEESLFRLIASPYICEILMVIKEQQARGVDSLRPLKIQLIQAFVAEAQRENPGFLHSLRPQWTVGGDVVLDKDIEAAFPALQTECGILLNYQSYVHNTGKEGIGGYSYQMALRHKERIETGKRIVQEVSVSAHSLIETFTTGIQFRLNKMRPNIVNSSTHSSIGLIRCDNFHLLHTDMPEVVDMLVHESIHQYLHLFEEQLFSFVAVERIGEDLLNSREFPSPWSGNLLDIRSYTHAILVWFGLVHFWEQFVEDRFEHAEVSRNQALTKLGEALYGFLNSKSVLDNLGEEKKYLSPEYQNCVENLQEQLKKRHVALCS